MKDMQGIYTKEKSIRVSYFLNKQPNLIIQTTIIINYVIIIECWSYRDFRITYKTIRIFSK